MHYIQKNILDQLRVADSMRYAKLNTTEVESSHFRYHLTQLIQDGYVQQLERGLYGLTLKGQSYLDKLSEHSVMLTPMPKVITYTLLRDGDTVLLQEKSKQPYAHLLNMIGGKLHEGEVAQQAAVREVSEKIGAVINSPELKGVFEILINSDESLLTHVIAYVFVAEVDAAGFMSHSVKQLAKTDLETAKNLAPDFMPIFNAIDKTTAIAVDSFTLEYTI